MWCNRFLRFFSLEAQPLKLPHRFAEFRYQVEETEESARVVGEDFPQFFDIEVGQEEANLLQWDVPGELGLVPGGLQTKLLPQPILVVGFSPAREVVFVQASA